jgi:hypothetical protein
MLGLMKSREATKAKHPEEEKREAKRRESGFGSFIRSPILARSRSLFLLSNLI